MRATDRQRELIVENGQLDDVRIHRLTTHNKVKLKPLPLLWVIPNTTHNTDKIT